MNKKNILVVVVLLVILCSGCALNKDQNTAKVGNAVPKPTKNEVTNKELFKGKVDKSNLFQIYEFQYSGEQANKKLGVYVNLSSCFTGEKMAERPATDKQEASVESGSVFVANNAKNVKISVYTSTDNYTPPTKDYYTAYGQKISFDGSFKDILDGKADASGQYGGPILFMKNVDDMLWRVVIDAPEQWVRSNQVLLTQFLDSIVVLDENDEAIEQGK